MDIEVGGPLDAKNKNSLVAGKKKQIAISMDLGIVKTLDHWARRRGIGRSNIVAILCTEGIERWEKLERDQDATS